MPDPIPPQPDRDEKSGEGSADDFFKPVYTLPSLLKAGDVVSNRFEIVAEIGAGGMGQVYLVKDILRSGQERALKTVLPVYSADPRFADRFLTEIGAALNVSHPNVCRVYDFGVDSQRKPALRFYTMEYLPGETLAERLKREPDVTPERALIVLRGIAAGLDAAHARGIVHRDLKPGNIMLVDKQWDRPVLMDFGLAKSFDMDTPLTRTVDRLGTPAFMAPEQFSGGTVSPATDIYALGQIVCVMVKEPPSERWKHAIDRARSINPQERFPSANALVLRLESSVQWRQGRRKLLWLAGGAATLAFSGYGYRYIVQSHIPAVPLIMLLPVIATPDLPNSVAMAQAFERVLSNKIRSSDKIELVSDKKIADRRKELGLEDQPVNETTAQRIAAAEGATGVLFAQLGRIADQFQVQLRLRISGHLHTTEMDVNNIDDLLGVPDSAASWVRGELGRQGVTPRSSPMPELTTSKWAALEQYVAGDEAFNTGKPSEDVIARFTEAIKIDPQFAAAEGRLGDILVSFGRSDEGLRYSARAAELAKQNPLTAKEGFKIRGQFASDTGNWDESEQVYDLYKATYPDDGLGYFYQASVASALGRGKQALGLIEDALAKDPKNWKFVVQKANLQADSGQLKAALETLKGAKPAESDEGWLDQTQASILFALRQFPAQERAIDRVAASADPKVKSRGYTLKAWINAEHGATKEARASLNDGLDFDVKKNFLANSLVKRRLLAQLTLLEGDHKTAIDQCREILALIPRSGYKERMHIGCLLAQLGQTSAAEKCKVPGLKDWPIYQHWSKRLQGEIALAKGEATRAFQLLSDLPSNGEMREWPEYLARAAKAAGMPAEFDRQRQGLKQTLARYVIEPERTGIQFVRKYLPEHFRTDS